MSNFEAVYAFVGIISFVLGIAFFFIDGMLLWCIVFYFSLLFHLISFIPIFL